MLLQLNINNFTLIDNLTINFESGFNVFTGETGAGKSILIDAINYVLGGKFGRDFIRTGEEKTYVEAVFTLDNPSSCSVLDSLGIEYDDIIIVSRETFSSGKSIAKVNGKSIIISNVRQIGQTLLDIHGQHENQNLLHSSSHINYLDFFAQEKISSVFGDYSGNYKSLKEIENKIMELEGQGDDKSKLTDFLKFQIDEIENAKLRTGEDVELESEFTLLANSEKINNTLSHCYSLLYEGTEEQFAIIDSINMVIRDLRSVEKHMDSIKAIANSLQESYYNLEQSAHDIRGIKDSVVYDETRLELINSRIYAISGLKKKYGKTIEAIIEYRDKIGKQYDEIAHATEHIKNLKMEKQKIIGKMKIEAEEIHNIRSKVAKELEEKVKKELSYIGLEKSSFIISVTLEEEFHENGCDVVQFLISTNPGEPARSLEKVVSGGELSRIMLALKTVFVDKDKIPTVIFDEIDTGISGSVAQSVGEKMYAVSKGHQVFCVTHLPQIACISDQHFLVRKDVNDNKTFTTVMKMKKEEREYEIARMIGGNNITKITLDNSKELIKMAHKKKGSL